MAGHLLELALVVDRDGRFVARVQQVVQRTSTRAGGVAVRATTVAPDEGLFERVGALVAELGWWGLTELQFIVPPGGEPIASAHSCRRGAGHSGPFRASSP